MSAVGIEYEQWFSVLVGLTNFLIKCKKNVFEDVVLMYRSVVNCVASLMPKPEPNTLITNRIFNSNGIGGTFPKYLVS